MDRSKSAVDMLQKWTSTQQEVWSAWLDTMQGIGRTPTPDLRGKIIDTWEHSISYTLETQAELMATWIESVAKAEGAPDSVKEWADQSQAMLQHWQEAQKELWAELFSIVRAAQPGTPAFSLQRQGLEIFRAWQESVRSAIPLLRGGKTEAPTSGRGTPPTS